MLRLERETLQQQTRNVTVYQLCLAWEWQYDAAFVQQLEAACSAQGVSLLQITPHNLEQVLESLSRSEVSFRILVDRASDSDDRFYPLVEWARSQSIRSINPYGLARRAWDKSNCHQSFARAGLPIPTAITIPSYHEQPDLPQPDLSILGSSFSIKPAHGGGGVGVITGVTSWDQVLQVRQEFPFDQYLLQAYIVPTYIGDRQAWFRIIYCAGDIHINWWDTNTHIYIPVTPEEEEHYNLHSIRDIVRSIYKMVQLELFSTEICQTQTGEMVIVDYVNDPIDLRPQSTAREGVPDQIVTAVANRLASLGK